MYAIMASGLTLIWGTMKMLNFAHGEFYMMGAYILYLAIIILGVPPFFSILLMIAIVFVVGVLIEKTIIHPLLDKPGFEISTIIATLGFSVFFQNFALRLWGERFKSIPYFWDGTLNIFGIQMANQRIFIFAVTTIIIIGFWVLIKKSKFGLSLRATSQNRDAATVLGIDTRKMYTLTFGISCAMASFAAPLLSPIFSINPWMGQSPLLKAFITVVLGGLGSFEGAILGGILLGIVESISVILFASEWKDVVAFGILILVLVIRPSGLFGAKEW
jgi:branched-chain amino acid transport system permease protein